MKRGRFIAVEGGDGAGKSTQAKELAASLGGYYIAAPSEGSIGRLIRRVLSNAVPFPGVDALQLLFLADRAEMAETTLKPGLANGETIVADRWSLSGLVYGGVDAEEAGEDMGRWRAWYAEADGRTLRPDAYVVLDVPAGVAVRRMKARGGTAERYDRTDRIDRVCARYNALRGHRYLGAPIIHVDGLGTPQEVARRVRTALQLD